MSDSPAVGHNNPPVYPTEFIRIEVPGDPKGVGRTKSRAITTKEGRTFAQVYTPAATRTEAGVIRMYAEKAMAGRPPMQGSIELRVSMFMSIPKSMSKKHRALALATPPMLRPKRKPDWDNNGKFTDAFKSVVWHDDAHVSDAHVFKRYSDRPRVVFLIREICP